jgi:hypothetical protein
MRYPRTLARFRISRSVIIPTNWSPFTSACSESYVRAFSHRRISEISRRLLFPFHPSSMSAGRKRRTGAVHRGGGRIIGRAKLASECDGRTKS